MKVFSRLFFSFCAAVLISFLLVFSAFCADISFTADRTSGSTDDVFQIRLAIDGEVDNGQVGIEGLDNFTVVGQRSSSRIQVINGKTKSVQEKIISVQPKKSGNLSLTVVAYQNGEKIRSTSLSFDVQKSLLETTKETLLKDSSVEKKEKEGSVNSLLTSPQNSIVPEKTGEDFTNSALENFPAVEHISAFNFWFWLQFLGIFIFLIVLFVVGFRYSKKLF